MSFCSHATDQCIGYIFACISSIYCIWLVIVHFAIHLPDWIWLSLFTSAYCERVYRRYLNWRISVENGRPVANFFLFCSPEDGLSLCYAWYTNYCIRVGKKCSFKKPKFLHLYIHSNNSAKIQPIEPKFGILVLRVIRYFLKKNCWIW